MDYGMGLLILLLGLFFLFRMKLGNIPINDRLYLVFFASFMVPGVFTEDTRKNISDDFSPYYEIEEKAFSCFPVIVFISSM